MRRELCTDGGLRNVTSLQLYSFHFKYIHSFIHVSFKCYNIPNMCPVLLRMLRMQTVFGCTVPSLAGLHVSGWQSNRQDAVEQSSTKFALWTENDWRGKYANFAGLISCSCSSSWECEHSLHELSQDMCDSSGSRKCTSLIPVYLSVGLSWMTVWGSSRNKADNQHRAYNI